VEIPADLRTSLDAALSRVGLRSAAETVERLIEAYRSDGPPPTLSTMDSVLAYAGYRMPATYSAVRAALRQVATAVPGLDPRTQVDLGGGTGAAAWAALDQFPALSRVLVLDQSEAALELGRQLALPSRLHVVGQWQPAGLADLELAPADLITVSYVLNELAEADQQALVEVAARAGDTVLVVEPGTPAGYRRILAARRVLIEAGLHVVAPCPHQQQCPMVPGKDWCHFSVRVNRSSVHRRLKAAELGYEDEKFSYVAAVRTAPADHGTARVLRRPHLGKGLVSLYLCTQSDGLSRTVVSKRQGEAYRAARDLSWGDAWPY
jgi:ribosomal protein RSM22 (predicted rRNA methylase)